MNNDFILTNFFIMYIIKYIKFIFISIRIYAILFFSATKITARS